MSLQWIKRGLYPTRVSPLALVWAVALLMLLAAVDRSLHQVAIFLVPPFAAMLSILLYLPQQPVAQPLPVIVGSTVAAALGTAVAGFTHGPWAAAIVAAILLIALPRVGLYHPPAIALSMYPLLLRPGPWFPLLVVLPFSFLAVMSHVLLSRIMPAWPRYPQRPEPDDVVSE
jgi:CBS-domain-containing membrane protein